MKLLQYVIIFLIVFYGLRLLFRLLLPLVIQYLFKKTQGNMKGQYGAHPPQEEKKEGEVTIDRSANKRKSDQNDKDGTGEYVDFEDVE